MAKILYIIFIYIIIKIKCQKCFDQSCDVCSEDGNYCYKCKLGFVKHYSNCGKECNTIINCNLCSADETKCVKCKSNCIFNGIYCDCTERYVLAFILIFFSIFMIAIIIFCLIHTSSRRMRRILNILYGGGAVSNFTHASISRHPLPEEINYNYNNNNRINELSMINDFNKNKIEVGSDIENKKCYVCKNNLCNLKLECGCFICFECEKKCIKVNMCLNCNKSITSMQQVSCSICFCNKKEISTFNCACKIVICKECYLKWRKQNNFCPSCRGPIL